MIIKLFFLQNYIYAIDAFHTMMLLYNGLSNYNYTGSYKCMFAYTILVVARSEKIYKQ